MTTFAIRQDGFFTILAHDSDDDQYEHFLVNTEFGKVEIRIRNRS